MYISLVVFLESDQVPWETLFKQPNDYSFVFVFKYTTYFITYNTNINMYFEGSVE